MKLLDLFEQTRASLFHSYQRPRYAKQAIDDNKMLATTSQRFWADGKRRKDTDPDYKDSFWMKGISLTRDRRYAEQWGNVVFELDQDKLKQRFKIIPFNWMYSVPNSISRKMEREEFLIVKSNADNYMKHLDKEEIDLGIKPILDTARLSSPEGEILHLDRYLKGIWIKRVRIDSLRLSLKS